jgi:Leucine-rich repeat (LRR) protein
MAHSSPSWPVPVEIERTTKMGKLFIRNKKEFPENIGTLDVRELWLHGPVILDVPSNILENESIRELNISFYGKNIAPCPAPGWIFEMRRLEKLSFSVCKFSSFSEKINQLHDLADLKFGCSLSDLEEFPDLSGLKSLKSLSVRGEAVQGQRLPAYSLFPKVLEGIKNLAGLEYLNLSDWRPRKNAECVPDIFYRFPDLEELSLRSMKLDFLPQSIFQLKRLKKLYLNDNKLDNAAIREIIGKLPHCQIDSDVVVYKPTIRKHI